MVLVKPGVKTVFIRFVLEYLKDFKNAHDSPEFVILFYLGVGGRHHKVN